MFAGAGGTGLGFKTAGYEIVGVVEKNGFATLTYQENLGVPVTPTDIEDLEPGSWTFSSAVHLAKASRECATRRAMATTATDS